MLATKPLVLRTGFELSTPKLAEVVAGTTVTLHEMRQFADGTTRGLVAIQNGPRGWVTMIPKDGSHSLVEAGGGGGGGRGDGSSRSAEGGETPRSGARTARGVRSPGGARAGEERRGSVGGGGPSADGGEPKRMMPTYVISAPKPLLARTEYDLQSGRVGELAPGTRVHVLESRPLPDNGGKRVRLALETSPTATYGWVTAITKSGQENLAPYLFEVTRTPTPTPA